MKGLGTGKKTRKSSKKKKSLIIKGIILLIMLAILGVCVVFLVKELTKEYANNNGNQGTEGSVTPSAEPSATPEVDNKAEERMRILEEAELRALSYDYDGAVELLNTVEDAALDAEVQARITEYQEAKAACVPVNINEVTHIFYHSLIVEPELGFAGNDSIAAGFKQWMTTIDEFNKITQTMYDNGYVLVSLRDLVVETTDDNGEVHFTPNENLMLPEGKKAYVLSLDDLSYYHSYDNRGIASKIVLDGNGEPTCEYISQDGTVITGAYDCVPLLDQFVAEHPDASYKGAKGIIALTGYNGILGYRTDIAYKTRENLDWDQEEWLEDHPDFDWDAECAEAKKVADAIKENGWEFASHTWGHVAVGSASMERIKADTEKWKSYVEPLVGETDMIVFAHGEDIGSWRGYEEGNEKFEYFKSQGYNYFCNVDSTQYFLQIRDNYVRMGRRNLDGYRIWKDVHEGAGLLTDLFDASEILDPKRTDMPSL